MVTSVFSRPCLLVLLTVGLPAASHAEKMDLSPDRLGRLATHTVTGAVLAIYERNESKDGWNYRRFIAEVRVIKCEQGVGVSEGELIYVRYWRRKWIGQGLVPPRTLGHRGLPASGQTLRIYLARNAYDGSDHGNNDDGFNVLLANGFEKLPEADQPQSNHATAKPLKFERQ